MQHSLTITTRSQADVLERVLRVTRHRGFLVQSMHIEHEVQHLPAGYAIELTVTSERPIAHLTNQLVKLFDVEQVTLKQLQAVASPEAAIA
ncbi:acetolactate synthase 2 small subunit [Agarivorans sp. Toyoura001]|uniref:acetolactate synthase 2 small subunit n=1 Tax=unclassified Agarivorans TaxID=2636026 RepID=UPI0010EE695B|nr:acetolactate synthase 2 small subunit [Agarivorans sp. Toyoura001]GDY26238.1 acetolactate synthase [Agarivorans sp. Toyoura001]